jgi:hypothetical protein
MEATPTSFDGTTHEMRSIDRPWVTGVEAFHDRLAAIAHRLETLPMRDDAGHPHMPAQRNWPLRTQRRTTGVPIAPGGQRALMDQCAKVAGAPPRHRPGPTWPTCDPGPPRYANAFRMILLALLTEGRMVTSTRG